MKPIINFAKLIFEHRAKIVKALSKAYILYNFYEDAQSIFYKFIYNPSKGNSLKLYKQLSYLLDNLFNREEKKKLINDKINFMLRISNGAITEKKLKNILFNPPANFNFDKRATINKISKELILDLLIEIKSYTSLTNKEYYNKLIRHLNKIISVEIDDIIYLSNKLGVNDNE